MQPRCPDMLDILFISLGDRCSDIPADDAISVFYIPKTGEQWLIQLCTTGLGQVPLNKPEVPQLVTWLSIIAKDKKIMVMNKNHYKNDEN